MNKEQIISNLLGNILDSDFSNKEYITIAELNTVEKNGLIETIDINTALISPKLINKIKASHTNPFVNRTGVNYHKDFTYNPSFNLYLSPSAGLKQAEPLVVSWASGNHTTLSID